MNIDSQQLVYTVDAIINYKGNFVLIERKNAPHGLALPGGKVNPGESLEEAVVREVQEETGLYLTNVKQFKTYSDPGRDPRFRAISTVFVGDGIGQLVAGSDANDGILIRPDALRNYSGKFAFDHEKILADYLG